MRRIAAVLGFVLFALASRAFAVGSLADVTVYDRSTGQVLPVYSADGQRYIAGRPGNEYELRIRNNTGEDILAVVSVDGVNVVTGETAATSQGGYVVGGWRSLSIAGWRKSLSHVAMFYFTDHSDAYATRTGRPDDVGVIGVAVFKRKPLPPVEIQQPPRAQLRSRDEKREPAQSSANADAAGAPSSMPAPPMAEKSIGTGHGRTESSHARYVEFERESDLPNEVIALRYDTRANLVARGIIRTPPREPNPFPARFVPDPPVR
jgi:hypothetical protein